MYITLSILEGGVYFEEFSQINKLDIIMFFVGVFILLIGVFIINTHSSASKHLLKFEDKTEGFIFDINSSSSGDLGKDELNLNREVKYQTLEF